MQYKSPLLVVKDLQRSLEFYQKVLGLRKTVDFGANVTLTGGISLQTEESWLDFIGRKPSDLTYGGNVSELYFEAEDYDAFLKELEGAELVHPPIEHRWGQRAVRLYDPDRHGAAGQWFWGSTQVLYLFFSKVFLKFQLYSFLSGGLAQLGAQALRYATPQQ